jgi:hypothetical protein
MTPRRGSPFAGPWGLLGLVLLVAIVFVLRSATDIKAKGPVFDERWITRPMAELVRHGWSVDTAIDYQETKGPALIWPYALWAGSLVDDPHEVVSPQRMARDAPGIWESPLPGGPAPAPPLMLSVLRGMSMLCFVLGGLLLLVLARVCNVRGPPLLIVCVLYALLPYQLVFSQLVMGEASFVLLAIALLIAVCWGMGDGRRSVHRYMGPLLYGLLLWVALHNRLHALAFAPAVCLVAWQREDLRSWPWWLASLGAVLLRVPLWVRWGGPVTSDFQNVHGMGLRLESLTYLGAAMALPLGCFLLAWAMQHRRQRLQWLPVFGMGLGLLLAIVAMPDLTVPGSLDMSQQLDRYQGLAASLTLLAGGLGIPSGLMIAVLCAIGLGGLGALTTMAHRWRLTSLASVVLRVQAFALGAGWLLYSLTRGFVFDRYVMIWAVALPIAWLLLLPRWLLVLQTAALVIAAGLLIDNWLL